MRAAVSTLRRLRVLANRARIYYGMHGPISTARKVIAYLLRHKNPEAAPSALRFGYTGLVQGEIRIPYSQHSIVPVGPITRRTTIAQYIELGFDSLQSLELLLGTYERPNTNKNYVALYSELGELLHYEEFRSDTVTDNAFWALALPRPVPLKQVRGIWLLLSSDGDKENCITAWKSEEVSTGLFAFAESFETVRAKVGTLRSEREALLTGTIVCRIRGSRTASSSVYSLPPCPDDFDRRLSKDRLRTAAYVGGDAALKHIVCERLNGRTETTRIFANSSAVDELLKEIEGGEVDVVILAGVVPIDDARRICSAAALRYVPSVYMLDHDTLAHAHHVGGSAGADRTVPFEIAQALCWTNFCASEHQDVAELARRYRKRVFPAAEAIDARSILAAYRQNCRPLVSIVTILYKKEDEIPAVLDSYARQTYTGPLEVVFVDDCSPDASVKAVEDYLARARARATPEVRVPEVRIVRNKRKSGKFI